MAYMSLVDVIMFLCLGNDMSVDMVCSHGVSRGLPRHCVGYLCRGGPGDLKPRSGSSCLGLNCFVAHSWAC